MIRTIIAKSLLPALICTPLLAHAAEIDKRSCSLKGIPLHGKVKIVKNFADFKIEVVPSFPDLKVEKVSSFADRCGQWQIVDSFPDFTVEIVNSFGDFRVTWVNSFPGVGN
ncbi:hypothetical protein [Pandoraea anhela]|uniref:7(1) septoil knot domain-containing protein n=1 Tax=Pandoraea anhela TaxID=2508295 RepID=A0A5E4U0Z3_9BURK|nr:hypothetical protein [Pandoraea anhela]VVD92698.1 hypothetical protein PAN31108_01703 [Pandoraea anhela]